MVTSSIRRLATPAAFGGLLLLSPGAVRGQQPGAFPRVTIPNTERRALSSRVTERDYDVYVYFPSDYDRNTTKRYPVLYLLDGQWDFKLLASIQGGLLYDRSVPEVLVVGITYSGDDPDYNALRAMDYTPVARASNPGSGDAPKFLQFLERKLIPFVQTNYRADPAQRAIMGSSFGGLFALYALFAHPGLFQGVVAASPAVTYGDRAAFSQEAAYAAAHRDLPARLYIAVGSEEGLAQPVREYMETVRGRHYRDLTLETRVITGERHSGNKPEAFNRGLRFIFGAHAPTPQEGVGTEPQPGPYEAPRETVGPIDGAPAGTLGAEAFYASRVYPDLKFRYQLYVRAQYRRDHPAALMVFQDGRSVYLNVLKTPQVFDNLIHSGDMPVTVAVFIDPGTPSGIYRPAESHDLRSLEYDSMDDRYVRFLLDEILPDVVLDSLAITDDPDGWAVAGQSSGGIAAFTAAWQRPSRFRRVLTQNGSFVNIRGGNAYPGLIRAAVPKPLRVYLLSGTGDLDNRFGRWLDANAAMAAALDARGYDYRFRSGSGGHFPPLQALADYPDALRWLWRGYPREAVGR